VSKQLSQKRKIIFSNWCRQRDGNNCLYCGKPITSKCILDHLNDIRADNRLENFVNAHQSCNVSKLSNYDYQIIAMDKLKQNEKGMFIPKEEDVSEASTEIKISQNNFEITEKYISEKIITDGEILWHDALYGSVYQCKKKTDYGSVQCVRNYLFSLTCLEAPFMRTKNENGKSVIQRRVGN